MTDFLARLVQRSFDPAAAVRPRVASLFEPVRRSGLPPADVAEPQEGAFAREAQPGRADDEKAIEPRGARSPHEGAAARVEAGRVVQDIPPRVAADPVIDAARSLPPPPSVHPPAPAEGVHREYIARDRDASISRETPRPTSGPDLVTPGWPSKSEDRRDVTVPSAGLEVSSKHVDGDQRGLVVPPTIGAGIAAQLQAAVSALHARPGERRTAAAEPADAGAVSEPSVHVTIGRVEVRATTDSAPVRRRPASPVMSLDEYLRIQARRGSQ